MQFRDAKLKRYEDPWEMYARASPVASASWVRYFLIALGPQLVICLLGTDMGFCDDFTFGDIVFLNQFIPMLSVHSCVLVQCEKYTLRAKWSSWQNTALPRGFASLYFALNLRLLWYWILDIHIKEFHGVAEYHLYKLRSNRRSPWLINRCWNLQHVVGNTGLWIVGQAAHQRPISK